MESIFEYLFTTDNAIATKLDQNIKQVSPTRKSIGKGKTAQNSLENCAKSWHVNYAKIDKICTKVGCTLYGWGVQMQKILIDLNLARIFL